MENQTKLVVNDIYTAQQRLESYICQTPMIDSSVLSSMTNTPVHLKLEHQQITNSFKIRGASNAIGRLSEKQKKLGVVCVSTGNHGRGIAFAAKRAGMSATIYMSSRVPDNKVEAIAELGAQVRVVGQSQDDAEDAAKAYCKESGAVYLPPFDHKDIISGQGTIGLEIFRQQPDTQCIVVPMSGGGLISGITLAARSINPNAIVYGISMQAGAAMIESQRAGKPILVEELPTFADSLGGGIGLDNQYTFSLVKDYVDQTVQVSEANIAQAIRHAYFNEKQIIEGGSAVGIAAILTGKLTLNGPTVVLLSGCNIDMNVHKAVLDGADNLSSIEKTSSHS